MDAQKLGIFIQTQRKALGLTQSQLAERLQVTDKAVSRWERGVGLPDIQLLEPLAQALEISLTELIRSEILHTDTLPKDAADAAVAETLALAEKRRRKAKAWLCSFLVWAVEVFFIGVITWFVDVLWIRIISLFLVFQCVQVIVRLADALLYPEKNRKKYCWRFYLKVLILSVSLLLYPLIFLQQPWIGLEACGWLALLLTALLIIWGLWEVHHYVETMPDGQDGAPL